MPTNTQKPSDPYLPDHLRWNHNIHYHPILLAHLPPDAKEVLDIGCGDGMLTRQVAARVQHITGIDLDERSITLAKMLTKQANVTYLLGDVMSYPFPDESFDTIISVATLHHLDTWSALERFARLLRPGGSLGIIGLARPELPRDLLWELAGSVSTKIHLLTKSYWEHSAPIVWPPPHTNRQVRQIASQVLPTCRFRRHLLWRYSLLWVKPIAQTIGNDKS